MTEREEAGRLPGEVVEVYRAPLPGRTRDPREVIEVYRQPDTREVVEVYSRPIPVSREGRAAPSMPAGDRRRRQRRGLIKFLVCVAVLVGLAVAARMMDRLAFRDGGGAEGDPAFYEPETVSIPSWPVDQGTAFSLSRERGEALTAQEVYRRVNPTVVTVQCLTDEGVSMGTGVIFTGDGYVITNYHVIRGGKECYVTLDSGYGMEVCYVAGDADSDLAVLKIPPGELQTVGELPAASFGDSERLVVGDPVYAIGAPRRLRGTRTRWMPPANERKVHRGRGWVHVLLRAIWQLRRAPHRRGGTGGGHQRGQVHVRPGQRGGPGLCHPHSPDGADRQ